MTTEPAELIIEIDALSATKEKRMIAFNAEVDGAPYKFIMSIADFAHFGVDNAGLDPAGSVDAITTALSRLIGEKHRKDGLAPTTKLGAL